jgi:integrase
VSVYQDKRGKWIVEISVRLPTGEIYRERIRPKVTSKTLAKEWERSRIIHIQQHGPGRKGYAGDAPTLDEFKADFWKKHVVADGLKPSTVAAYESHWRLYLSPHFGNVRLDRITAERIAEFKADLQKTPAAGLRGKPSARARSKKTINNILGSLSAVLSYAKEWSHIKEIPPIVPLKRQKPPPVFYRPGDYETLVTAARRLGTRWEVMMLLGGEAGLRSGEFTELQWPDVNLADGYIVVSRSVWRGHVTETKGFAAVAVPMTDRLVSALLAHKETSTSVYVLARDNGKQPNYNQVQRWMVQATRAAGMTPRRGVHILRHTFGTRLMARGARIKNAQQLLRHQDSTTTEGYAHAISAYAKEEIKRLEPAKE